MKNRQKKDKPCKCPHCGASLAIHRHRLSRGLISILIEFRKSVLKYDRNMIDLRTEVNLTKTQYNNAQKLRYHGLIAKYVDPVTKQHVAGYWLLTRRGNQFCKNMIELPFAVYTFRNKIVDKENQFYKLSDILSNDDMPYWDEKDDFTIDFADISDLEEIKYDRNGQGFLPFKNEKDEEDENEQKDN